jgi:hypothetical protein
MQFSFRNISDFCRVPLFHNLLVPSLLAITANSEASERIFSEIGRMVEARDQQLPLGSLDCIMFLRNFSVVLQI